MWPLDKKEEPRLTKLSVSISSFSRRMRCLSAGLHLPIIFSYCTSFGTVWKVLVSRCDDVIFRVLNNHQDLVKINQQPKVDHSTDAGDA